MKANTRSLTNFTGFTSAPANPAGGVAKLTLAALLLAGMAGPAGAATWTLGSAWYVTNGVANIANNNNNRGLAYSAVSNQVFVATRSGPTTGFIDVFNGATGALLSGAGGVTGANLGIDQIGIGDDSTLYGMPLITAVSGSSLVSVYSWTNWNSTPYLAYQSSGSDPVGTYFNGKRIGDTMAVRGSGANTLILAAVATACTNFVLLHTADGVNFSATAITNVSGLPQTGTGVGGNFCGIAFYTNNTFLIQPGPNAVSRNVYLVSYPANFASQTAVSGTLLGNAAGLSTVPNEWLDYSAEGKMLAVAQAGASAQNAVNIFSLTNYPASADLLAAANFATPNANGNATAGVALGGQGKTNYLYVLESNNGLQAYTITYSVGAVGPTIGTQPVGVSNIFPPQKLTVTVNGTEPFHYQWYQISGGVTNAVGANTNYYFVTSAGTNGYFVVVTNAALTANVVTSSVATMALLTPVLNPVVTQLWTAAAGDFPFLTTSDNTRGLAYDTNSQRVIVAGYSTGSKLYLLDGNTGTNIGIMNMTGASFPGLIGGVDQVGAADDGAVYACNLVNAGGTFDLYRWSAPDTTSTATLAYTGDPAPGYNDRWGDTMAVRGAGTGTQILIGSKGTNVVLFTTADGTSFTPTLMAITNVPSGFAGNGVAFGAGNTFWAKKVGGDLYEVAFDPGTQTGGYLRDFSTAGQIPSNMTGVGADPVHNIVAGIMLSDHNNDLQLFQLTGTSDPPVLFHQAFFGSYNPNGNGNGVVVMKYPRVYALDVNNGVVAATYGVPAATAPTITTPPASQTVYTNNPLVSLSVSASGSVPMYYQWRYNFANIPNATNSIYTLTNPPVSASGYYDVVVHNIAGYATSTPPALLTVITPVQSATVTHLWTLPAGSRSYLDGSSYNTRGLAYDTNSGTLLLADHTTIYLLAGNNGSELGQLNMLGLGTGGANGWVVDQLGVADDGVLYSGNLSLTGSGFYIVRWPTISPGAAAANYAWGPQDGTGADPSGSGDRWGDTMAVRGAGDQTEILCGSYSGTRVALFTNSISDVTVFAATVINVTNAPAGFAGQGIAFGAGNTFWAKSPGYNLRQVSYDAATGIGWVTQSFTAGTQINSSMDGIDVDVVNNVLSGVVFSDAPDNMALYVLSGTTNPPALFQQEFFGSVNPNSQLNAVTTLKNGLGFGLDVNNGLVALSYPVPLSLPTQSTLVQSFSYQTGAVALTWQTIAGRSYQVQYRTNLLTGNWSNVGPVLGSISPTTSYADPTASDATRFYRVQVQ